MTSEKIRPHPRSLFLSAVASWIFLLATSLAWLPAQGVAMPSRSDPVCFRNPTQRAPGPPGLTNPAEVVKTVERNRKETSRDAALPMPVHSAEGLGSAFHIGGTPVYRSASGAGQPSVGFGSGNYLVAWAYKGDIYGTRVSVDGVVLDSVGIVICADANGRYNPSIAFDGVNYLVVWEDYRNGTWSDIYGARVSVAGVVLDTAGIPISAATSDQVLPSVAFDGTNYLVVWQDGRSESSADIYGSRVSVAGVVLDTAGIPISAATSDQVFPSVAFDGTNYLVVWTDYRSNTYGQTYGSRVSVGGVVLDTAGIAISTAANEQSNPSIAFDGANYFVVWETMLVTGLRDVCGARVSVEGVVLDTAGIAISTARNQQRNPDVKFDGSNYLVVWSDNRNTSPNGDCQIYGARVSVAGVVLDTAGISISTEHGSMPCIAFDGTNYLVVWGCLTGIYGARVNVGGVVADANIGISKAANSQSNPSIAFDGTNYLVVWDDDRNPSLHGGSDIYGARVTADGVVLDTAGIPISAATSDQVLPSVAFDGTNYLVIWTDYRSFSPDIYGARVSVGGVVLDPAGIAISTAANSQYYPAVGFDGTNYLVVWQDSRLRPYHDIYGTRISVGGVVLDTAGIAICTAANEQGNPSIAFDGTNYMVVWQDGRSGSSADSYGTRVSVDGVVLDTAGIAICTAANEQWNPSIAFDGTNYFVVWEDHRNESWGDIYGTRVSAEGVVLDTSGVAICTVTNRQEHPSIGFDGTNYLIVWEDSRGGASFDVYATRVSVGGVVFDSLGIPVSTEENYQYSPFIARGPSESLLITYSSFTGPPYDSYRIWGNLWREPTGLTFASATAHAERDHVTLSWQVTMDVSASSFRIERSETPSGQYAKLGLIVKKDSEYSFSCIDRAVESGKTYWYRIVLGGLSGQEEAYGPIEVNVESAPVVYQAYQSYPNPFNPRCTIRYDIPRAGRMSLRVFDVDGSLVRTLVDAWREPGVYSEVWDGKADDGTDLSSGVYFYRLAAGDFVATRKMVLIH